MNHARELLDDPFLVFRPERNQSTQLAQDLRSVQKQIVEAEEHHKKLHDEVHEAGKYGGTVLHQKPARCLDRPHRGSAEVGLGQAQSLEIVLQVLVSGGIVDGGNLCRNTAANHVFQRLVCLYRLARHQKEQRHDGKNDGHRQEHATCRACQFPPVQEPLNPYVNGIKNGCQDSRPGERREKGLEDASYKIKDDAKNDQEENSCETTLPGPQAFFHGQTLRLPELLRIVPQPWASGGPCGSSWVARIVVTLFEAAARKTQAPTDFIAANRRTSPIVPPCSPGLVYLISAVSF